MKITISKQQWESVGKMTGWMKRHGSQFHKTATGEPDQDYDHETYNAITNLIKVNCGIIARHREFDKYQGVYVAVPGVGMFWTVDRFVVGKHKKPDAKYQSAELINSDGDNVSYTRGDYFLNQPDLVLKDYILKLTDFQGKKTVIQNPKVKDLPDLLDVAHGIEFESEPDDIIVLQEEKSEEKFNVRITPNNQIAYDGGLTNYINDIIAKKK